MTPAGRCRACDEVRDGDPIVTVATDIGDCGGEPEVDVHLSHTTTPGNGFYGARVLGRPGMSIEEHAAEMGVDPADLRRFLANADRTPPTPDQTDDLRKLLKRLDAIGEGR